MVVPNFPQKKCIGVLPMILFYHFGCGGGWAATNFSTNLQTGRKLVELIGLRWPFLVDFITRTMLHAFVISIVPIGTIIM